jgi:hypothetical protein
MHEARKTEGKGEDNRKKRGTNIWRKESMYMTEKKEPTMDDMQKRKTIKSEK